MGACIEVLNKYESRLKASLEESVKWVIRPQSMLLRGFAFGRTTLGAMTVLSDYGQPEADICLPTLARPFYELAVRLLWASRGAHGWERLLAYYASEDKRWAQRATKLPSLSQYAAKKLNNANTILGRTDVHGNHFEQPLGINAILTENEQGDIACGIKTEPPGFASWEYANIWQMMCGTSHAHITSIIGPAEAHAKIGVGGAVAAAFALLRAVAMVLADDRPGLNRMVDEMGAQINQILRRESAFVQ